MSELAAPERQAPPMPASSRSRRLPSLPTWLTALAKVNGWANYDFCPWANRYFTWLKSPLAWMAAAAIASGLVGAVAAPQGWVVCGALVGTMALGAIWPWVAVRGVSAELSYERTRCHEGDEVVVELAVANRWPWPVWGLLIEGGIDEDAALARVPAWSQARYRFAWRPERRGPLPRQVPQVATGFPFGLWTCRRPIAVARELLVWPRLTALRSAPFDRCDQPAIAGGLVDRPGDEGDLVSARPYRPGDSPRRVHWAHTSRRDTLIVCQRQTASQRHAVVALDPHAFTEDRLATRYQPASELSAGASGLGETSGGFGTDPVDAEAHQDPLDAALRVLASVCQALHRHGWQVVCELDGQAIRVSSQSATLRSLWDRLARHGFRPAKDGYGIVAGSASGSASGPGSGPGSHSGSRSGSSATRGAASSPSLHKQHPTPALASTATVKGEHGRAAGGGLRIVVTDDAGWRARPVLVSRRASEQLRWIVVDDAALEASVDAAAAEPWMRVSARGGEESEREWRRQWERRCHGDESFA